MTERTTKQQSCSDSELVRRCLCGDQTAWEKLIARYQRLIYSVARALLFDREDMADVFQGTCLDLYVGLPELRDSQALPAWLMTVTRRRVAAILKAKACAQIGNEPEHVQNALTAIEHEHAIERALEQMSPRCRELVELLYFNAREPTYAEISNELSIPVSSIGPTRARCLEKLRKLLM